MSDDVELLIAGGGLTGLMLGVACAGAGLAVAIIDRTDPAAMLSQGFDGRTAAIAYASRQVLAGIGIWEGVAAQAEPILEIRVADDGAPLFLHYDHRELNAGAVGEPAPALGYIVENRVLRQALIARARALPSLRLIAPRELERTERGTVSATAFLSGGERVSARLVAAADGHFSPLRREAGIKSFERRYAQIGIVTTVQHAEPHGGIAVEHFLPAGPFAILPMTDDESGGHRSSIVWTERAALAPGIMALSEPEFAAELSARFGDFLGPVAPIGPRFSYRLGLLQAERYVDRRLALVGEAAHLIHPIAGQGLNIGIRDVAALAELLIDARRLGRDIGDPDILQRYQRWCRFDATALAIVTDGLNRLFSNEIPAVRAARDLGLAVVNRAPPLKRLFMRHAMGLLGDQPRLARGEPL